MPAGTTIAAPGGTLLAQGSARLGLQPGPPWLRAGPSLEVSKGPGRAPGPGREPVWWEEARPLQAECRGASGQGLSDPGRVTLLDVTSAWLWMRKSRGWVEKGQWGNGARRVRPRTSQGEKHREQSPRGGKGKGRQAAMAGARLPRRDGGRQG